MCSYKCVCFDLKKKKNPERMHHCMITRKNRLIASRRIVFHILTAFATLEFLRKLHPDLWAAVVQKRLSEQRRLRFWTISTEQQPYIHNNVTSCNEGAGLNGLNVLPTSASRGEREINALIECSSGTPYSTYYT